MDAATERDLVQRARSGDRAALAELCAAHDGFCWRQAFRAVGRWPQLAFDDCLQAARIGLLRSLQTFDPDRGFRLLTYAGLAIRQQVRDVLRTHPLVVPPARDWARAPGVLRFSDLDVRHDGHPFDVLDRPAPDDWPWPVERRDLLRAINELREPDRSVLRARLAGETMRALATRLGRTKARVQQIEDRAATTVARVLLRLADRRLRGPVRRPRKLACPAS
jgi:RNA polymerase sigma factor (sigma-70 family)